MSEVVNLHVGHLWLKLCRTETGSVMIQIDDPSLPGTPALPTREIEAEIWADLVAALAEDTPQPLGVSLQPATAPPVDVAKLDID